MRPPFNSFPPQIPNQVQPNNAPFNPQVFSANPLMQNSMPTQPQMGIMNNPIPSSFSNSNAHLSHGRAMPNMGPSMAQQPDFTNVSNHLGMPQIGQFQVGYPPQNLMNNLCPIPMYGNQVNPCHPQGQIIGSNLSNLVQQLNQNIGLQNLQNLMQNMNTLLPLQAQNPSIFANPPFGVGQHFNPNQQNFGVPGTNASNPLPIATQQVQGNSSTPQQTQNSQSSAFRQQGNPTKTGHGIKFNTNNQNNQGINFKKNPRYQKSQFQGMDNGKRKFGFSNEHKKKVRHGNERAAKFGGTNPTNQEVKKRRSLAFIYTEQEIKRWREERRKNYPSKYNIEKKQAQKLANSEAIKREAALRRQQLKEILAKQAELGVEVAEIPSYYLSDSKQQVHGQDNNKRFPTKNKRFKNRNDKRGRYNNKDQVGNQQNFTKKDSSNIPSLNERKPTLLEKLLSADIKRDKCRLLQVFRFMVVNSFFKDWPEKPLTFPLVVVEEDESLYIDNNVSEISNNKTGNNFPDIGDGDKDDDDDKSKDDEGNGHNVIVARGTCFVRKEGCLSKEGDGTEEEGEIID